jgi:hypothetical protein
VLRVLLAGMALALPAMAWAGASAPASALSASDVAEIRQVINRQIEAFRRDDARGAFALASPGVQEVFGTPERFLETVRVSYQAVYRPASVAFKDVVVIGPDVVQLMNLTDGAGVLWVAYYAMQRQRDGSWRASGCRLVPPAKILST